MKAVQRFALTLVAAGALLAAMATPVLADAGAPGTTFPEQPGTHPATACASVTSNPGTGAGGEFGQNASPKAVVITTGLLVDACFGR
jgi:hypothetical protein